MPEPLVYIETTIPSFYHDVRTSPDFIARREWTRRWWDVERRRYRPVTSEAVIDELERGIQEHAEARIGLVTALPLLPIPDRPDRGGLHPSSIDAGRSRR